jgi:hypothetical protein
MVHTRIFEDPILDNPEGSVPLGLGLSVGPTCPLGPADRESVAPCQLASPTPG